MIGEWSAININKENQLQGQLRVPNVAWKDFSETLFRLEYDKDTAFSSQQESVEHPLWDEECLVFCEPDLDWFEFKSFHDGCRGAMKMNLKECDLSGNVDFNLHRAWATNVRYILRYADGTNVSYYEAQEAQNPAMINWDVSYVEVRRDASPSNPVEIWWSVWRLSVSQWGTIVAEETMTFTGN